MAAKSPRTQALQEALRILGSEKRLSRLLHVPSADLSKWLRGEGEPTPVIFLRTVDFLIERGALDQAGEEAQERPG